MPKGLANYRLPTSFAIAVMAMTPAHKKSEPEAALVALIKPVNQSSNNIILEEDSLLRSIREEGEAYDRVNAAIAVRTAQPS